MAKIARGLAIMAKNVPAPLETGDFGGGESGTKQGVRRTESRKPTCGLLFLTVFQIFSFSCVGRGGFLSPHFIQ